MKRLSTLLLIAAAAACGDGADGPVVARTAGQVLPVPTLAEFISERPQLPSDATVVGALTDLWLDLSLLAEAALSDSTLTSVDVSGVVARQVDDRLVRELLESKVVPDTVFTEDALRALFETDAPGAEVAAGHILFGFPDQATPEQIDSVRTAAQGIAARAQGGEDFDALAAEFSQDAANAQTGGSLGRFGLGSGLVEPFETAALLLQSGEVSDPVETVFGLHIIKVTERFDPEFEDIADAFRAEMVAQRMVVAESTYVAGVEGPAGLTLEEGAIPIARELAQRPGDKLSGRAGDRTLVTHGKGTYTAAEFLIWLREQPDQLILQVIEAPDEPISDLLENLGRYDVLLAEAHEQGMEVPQVAVDSLVDGTHAMLADFTSQLGLMSVTALPGEETKDAVANAVADALSRIVNGEAPFLDLGPISFALRDDGDGEVFTEQFPAVVAAVSRAMGGAPGVGGLPVPGGLPPGGAPVGGAPVGGAPAGGAPGGTPPGGG